MGTVEFLGEVKHWIAKLDFRIDEAALLVQMEHQQLERMLSFPELAPTLRPTLQLLDGLGLGLVGVEPLTTAMVIRYFDRCREAKKITKSDLAARAEVNRTHLTYMFQHADPDPKLETVFKLAAVLDCDLRIEQRRTITRPTAVVARSASSDTSASAATTTTPTAPLPTGAPMTAAPTPAAPAASPTEPLHTPSPTSASTPAAIKPSATTTAPPTPTTRAANTSPPVAPPPPTSAATPSTASTRAAPSPASPSSQPSAATPQPSAQPPNASPRTSAPVNATTPPGSPASTPTSNTPASSTGPSARPSTPPPASGTTPPNNSASGSTSHTSPSNPGPSARPTTSTTTSAGTPNSATSRPTSAPSRPTGAPSRPTIPVGSPSDPWAFLTGSTSPGTQPRAPAPSSSPPPAPAPQPASATTPTHLDPATNPALAHVFERLAQARERAELDAQQARFDLERARQQHEHERQLAARGAAERALAKQEAHQTTVAVGGTAITAALAGTAALALQQPESRRTAQAVMSIGGGALTAAAALAEEGSTTRKVLMTAGLVTAGVAAFDYLRQMFNDSRGGIGVGFHDGQDVLVIKLVRPLSAAAVAGLIVGDELIEVDGLPVAQLGRSEAIRRLRGPIGSPIALVVRRPTTSNLEWKLTLIRTPL